MFSYDCTKHNGLRQQKSNMYGWRRTSRSVSQVCQMQGICAIHAKQISNDFLAKKLYGLRGEQNGYNY